MCRSDSNKKQSFKSIFIRRIKVVKKTLNIIKNVFVWAVVVFAIAIMLFTIFSTTSFDQNNRSILGYKFFTVKTDSMSKTDFEAGDIIFVKEVDPASLKAGDIIAYVSQNEKSMNQTVTHKIRSLTTDSEGNPAFITYGTTTDTDDEIPVTYPYILGKYSGKIENLGVFFSFLKEPQGYILCIFIPFLILILYQGLNCIRLFRLYKKEQLEELEQERLKIEKERLASLEMMKELQELKKQLARKSADSGGQDTPSDEQ